MKKRILFLCTGNSCRSQIAEGLANNLFKKNLYAHSAGTNPTSINPNAIKIMKEINIDISNQKPQNISEFINKNYDYIITLCDNAKQTCPIFPKKIKTLHWSLTDPADAKGTETEILDVFRNTRDTIKKKLVSLISNF